MPDPTRAHGNSYECLLSAISGHSLTVNDVTPETELLTGP